VSPPRYAVIDVGTNSVKLHLGERGPDRRWATVMDRTAVTRLGEGLADTGVIGPAVMERTAAAIAEMTWLARQHGARAIAAVGTMGMRTARNRDDFIALVERRAGVRIEVVSGEEEARLAYLAVTSGLGVGAGSLCVFDTGGGSTQFTFGRGRVVHERFSVNVGAVRYTERFGLAGAVPPARLREALQAITADLSRLDGAPSPDTLVGLGGGITTIAAVQHRLVRYEADVVQGTVMERAEIERQIELYRVRSADERRGIVGLPPERADVILAGACIVLTVMDKLGKDSLTVSDRGLRHGLLIERFGR
jgi:exopolyphosphatase/guanosine-5'-triphosphate,3'-diphosphate pyrophosphatase